ncbi:hypothetical protein ACHAXT_002187 [Thalassiosira profunda]
MEAFALADVASAAPPGDPSAGRFDARLRSRLRGDPTPPGDDEHAFDAVRGLFGTAAAALQFELAHQKIVANDAKEHQCHCHWVPGRIEVVGKHTDYAGGNSLVCATSGRGMAMTSMLFRSNECNSNANEMQVTIISVLPEGMEHHATNTAAPYTVDGRSVVRRTIRTRNGQVATEDAAKAVDWTIYPTATIRRLAQNFGLHDHLDNGDGASHANRRGGHIVVALASNLPPASGLSTSSAFVTGLFLALDSHLHLSTCNEYRRAIGEDDDERTRYNLSTYLGNVENGRDYINGSAILKGTVRGGVGTFGGSEDHAAILMGRPQELRLLSFCPTRPASLSKGSSDAEDDITPESIRVHLSPDLTFVVAYSGAKAEKAGGTEGDTDASIGYNSASELARKAFDAYLASGEHDGLECNQTLADAIRWERKRLGAADTDDQSIKARISKRIKAGASEDCATALLERFEHFYDESECLVPSIARALSERDYDALGPLVDASHRGAVNLLRNQIEETAWLPLWARGQENALQTNPLFVANCSASKASEQSQRIKALAASAFGAGFGGSCWALVHRHQAWEFAKQWQAAYDGRFPATDSRSGRTREFFQVNPGPGAFWVEQKHSH